MLETASPEVAIEISVNATRIQDEIYQVSVTATVTTTIKERVAFLVEAQQSGIFTLRHIPTEQVDPMLGIVCPSIVYPYLRANIADLITRGGFAPIHLTEINFQLLYEQRLAQAAQAAQTTPEAPKTADIESHPLTNGAAFKH